MKNLKNKNIISLKKEDNLMNDYDFKQAVGIIVEDCEIIEDYIDC